LKHGRKEDERRVDETICKEGWMKDIGGKRRNIL
jgi:hypothetical protein